MSANLLQTEWANEQINLWTVEYASMPLIPGQTTYNVDPTTIMIMAAYVSSGEFAVTVDNSNFDTDEDQLTCDVTQTPGERDRILTSVDRDAYASFPDKDSKGEPTVYWFNKQLQPSITLWEAPDYPQRYTLHYYRARRMQDANMAGGLQADVPYQFLEAYVAALAFKLAEIWKPERMDALLKRASATFITASQRDVENAPLRITPMLSIYSSAVY
jgi:hypothetical protein